jgi:hypothetical protein
MRSGQAISYLKPDLDRRHARMFNARGDTSRSAIERSEWTSNQRRLVSDSSRMQPGA